MSITAATLLTRIGVVGAEESERKVAGFGDTLKGVSRGAGIAGAAMTAGVTAPLIGLATAAISAGTALNQELGNVQSLGVTQARVVGLKGAVQDIAIAYGKSTSDVADGLYQVVSAFGDTAETASLLETNVKLAAAGLSTVTDAINLTSAVTKGYGDTSAASIEQVGDLAMLTVKYGQTTLPELAQSIGKVVPLTGALGVSQQELFAIMAAGTGVTGNASEVSTQLRGALQALMAPTDSMVSLFHAQGVESGKALLKQEGLAGSLRLIINAAEESNTPLQSFIGSIEGQTLAMALAGPLAEAYADKLKAMTGETGALDAAFQAQTQGINAAGFAAEQAKVKWEVFLQKLGEGLAPAQSAVIDALTPITDTVLGFADSFVKMDPAKQQFIVAMAGIAAAAGPALLAVSAITGAIATIGLPLLVIGAGVALFAAAWATNWGDIQGKTATAVEAIRGTLGDLETALKPVGDPIDNWLATELPANLEAARGDLASFWTNFQEQFAAADQAVSPILGRIEKRLFTTFSTNMAQAQTDWSANLTGIQTAAATVETALSPVLGRISKRLSVTFSENTATAQADWNTKWSGFVTKATEAQAALQPVFDDIVLGLATNIPAALTAVQGDWDTTMGNLDTKAGETWTALQPTLTAMGTWLTTDLPANLAAMKTSWDTGWTGLTESVGRTWASIQLFGDWLTSFNPLETLQTAWDTGWSAMTGKITEAWNKLKEFQTWLSGFSLPSWLSSWLSLSGGFAGVAGSGGAGVGVGALAPPIATPTPLPAPAGVDFGPSGISGPASSWPGFAELTPTIDVVGKVVSVEQPLVPPTVLVVPNYAAPVPGAPGIGTSTAFGGGGMTAALVWSDYVPDLVWADYIVEVIWSDIFPAFKWQTFVPTINWATFVLTLSWGEFIKDINWSSFIPDISWGQFIPHINWGAFIPSLFGGGGGSSGSSTPAPGSGVPGDPLLVTPIAPSPWDPPVSVAMAGAGGGMNITLNFGPTTISNGDDVERLADNVVAAIRRRM